MIDKNTLCKKISSIYPAIKGCGIDVEIDFNEKKRAWIVDLEKGNYHLITHLEVDEAYQCLEGKECATLGFQIAHLVEYMKKR